MPQQDSDTTRCSSTAPAQASAVSVEIRNRWSGGLQFTASVQCAADAPWGVKVGLAVSWAYERGADLSGAVLRDADLRDADLSGADLSGAVLSGAEGEEYHVDGKIGIIDAGRPNHWAAFGYVDRDTQAIRLQVGCRRFSLAQGREYWAGKDHRRKVLAALDYIETIARLRGWTAVPQSAES